MEMPDMARGPDLAALAAGQFLAPVMMTSLNS